MQAKKVIFSALLVAGMTAGAASAEEATCANITFSAQALAGHPEIAEHCLEIVNRDGHDFVRMHAKVRNQTMSGPYISYSRPDGSWGKVRKANPPGGLHAMIDGQEIPVNKLVKNQEVNVYVGEDYWSAPVEIVAAPVEEVVVVEEIFEPEPVALPTTASNMPLLALFGGLLLMLGGVVRSVRNRG